MYDVELEGPGQSRARACIVVILAFYDFRDRQDVRGLCQVRQRLLEKGVDQAEILHSATHSSTILCTTMKFIVNMKHLQRCLSARLPHSQALQRATASLYMQVHQDPVKRRTLVAFSRSTINIFSSHARTWSSC